MTSTVLFIVLRVSVLLGAAALTAAWLRRSSAATRHLVWTAAIAASLLVPALSVTVPRVDVPLLPPEPVAVTTSPSSFGPVSRHAPDATLPRAAGEHHSQVATAAATPSRPVFDGSSTIALFWFLGAALVLARFAIGTIRMRVIAHRARQVEAGPWLRLAQRLASLVGVKRRVTFLEGAATAMPMTWGIVNPCVLLPESASEWPMPRQRVVLLHELAHVKRRDCLTQLLAQLLCAAFWFHPLAWFAARRLQAERERACDDVVLSAGTKGSEYADHLLEIARAMRSSMFPTWSAVGMAHRSQLEGRLLAILDTRIPRRLPTRRRTAALVAGLSVALIPIAIVTPVPRAAEAVTPDHQAESSLLPAAVAQQTASTARSTTARTKATTRDRELERILSEATRDAVPDATRDLAKEGWLTPAAAGSLRAITQAIGQAVTGGIVGGVAGGIRGGIEGRVAGGVSGGVRGGVEGGIRESLADQDDHAGRGGRRDPRTVAALVEALKDPDQEVRESAMQALANMRAPEALEAMRTALNDEHASVREQAAFALGQYRDRASVPSLAAALTDSSADVREQAVFALGQIRDPGSASAIVKALGDANASVREQAAFALGQIRDRSSVGPLTAALGDASASVREQAAFALGQIRDGSAAPAVAKALGDSSASVREQAAFALGQLRSRESLEPLLGALRDESPDVRQQAAFALGQLGDPRAAEALTAALKDANAEVRRMAAFALGQVSR